MDNVTLDDRDRSVLEQLRSGPAAVDALSGSTDVDAGYLRDRLPALADNGLVRRTGGDTYALTDDGSRVLEATATGDRNDRVDTPPAVEGRILAFDVEPALEAALRGAFAFLQYWGDASSAEVIDGVYSEHPAGYGDARGWWRDGVRDRLAELPLVDPPAPHDERWRFEGTPVVERGSGDGRVAAGADVTGRTSARFAIEQLELGDAERKAVRRVFDHLVELEEVSSTATEEQLYVEYDAGYASPDAWWDDLVGPALERLPGVERVDEEEEGERWRYRAVDNGKD